jgi:hypothetical protein
MAESSDNSFSPRQIGEFTIYSRLHPILGFQQTCLLSFLLHVQNLQGGRRIDIDPLDIFTYLELGPDEQYEELKDLSDKELLFFAGLKPGYKWQITLRNENIDKMIQETRNESIQRLKNLPYKDYLKSLHWSIIRTAALEADSHRCSLCNSEKQLNVHHRTYERRGHELPSDVTVLCQPCHAKFHDKLPTDPE